MPDTLKTISPIDGRVYVERPLETTAGTGPRARFCAQWGQGMRLGYRMPLAGRCEILKKSVDAFVAKAGDIAAEITWQMGRPIRHAPSEVRGFEERARYMLEILRRARSRRLQPGEKPGFQASTKASPARLCSSVVASVELSLPHGG